MTALLWPFFDQYGYLRAWVYVVLAVATLAAIGVGTGEGMRRADAVKCRNRAHAMHREYRSGILEGCLVRLDDGTFIPLGNLRTNDVERSK